MPLARTPRRSATWPAWPACRPAPCPRRSTAAAAPVARHHPTRIQQAAEQLGFQPNALARGLLAGRTFTVGLITTDSFGRFSIPVMLGAEDALGAGQISVFLCDTRDDPIREQHYLRHAARPPGGRHHRDRPPHRAAAADRRRPAGIPVVYAMTPSTDPADLLGGARRRRRRRARPSSTCSARGRRRIAHITGPERFAGAPRMRADGVRRRAGRGRACDWPRGGALFGEWSEEWGRQAADGLLRPAAGPGRDLLRQRPDRPGRGRRRCASRAGGCPRTSPWSASTTGRSSRPPAGRR